MAASASILRESCWTLSVRSFLVPDRQRMHHETLKPDTRFWKLELRMFLVFLSAALVAGFIVNAFFLRRARAVSAPVLSVAMVEAEYVKSENSKVYHKPGCRYIKFVKPGSLKAFRSVSDVPPGSSPCKTCCAKDGPN